jgi:hypothetical protein
LKILDATNGNLRSAGGELQQATLLFRWPRSNGLPEPNDDLVRLGVRAVIGVSSPVVHVDLSDTANEQLQLSLVKDVDELLRNELVEASHESLELILDPLLDPPNCDELDVFLLVLFGHVDVLASGLEVGRDNLAKLVVFHAEGIFNHIGNVVFPVKKQPASARDRKTFESTVQHPSQAPENLRIDRLHIGNQNLLL